MKPCGAKGRRRLIALGFACTFTLWTCGSNASGVKMADGGALEQLEQSLRQLLDQARSARGVAVLGSHPALALLAGERASELAVRTELASTAAELTDLEQRLWRLGYAPHYWRQAIIAGHLDEAAVRQTRLQPEFLRRDLEHVAISCREWRAGRERTASGLRAAATDQVLCVLMVGERTIRYQLRVAAPLRHLATVRQTVLAEVNRIRTARGLAPLQQDAHADAAAQRHAEDMLERGFYSHRNPDGEGPRERARAAGFAARGVAENIAKVVTSPADAVARWMASSGHRRNVLLRRARSHGLGVAVGIDDGEVVAYWCQLIGD